MFLVKRVGVFHVFVTVHNELTGEPPSNLSAIVVGTWEVSGWGNHARSSPLTKL